MNNRKELQNWAKENLKGIKVIPKNFGKPIEFTTKGIKEYLNQPHKFYNEKNQLLMVMPEILCNSVYIGRAAYIKDSPYIVASHIFETSINGEK